MNRAESPTVLPCVARQVLGLPGRLPDLPPPPRQRILHRLLRACARAEQPIEREKKTVRDKRRAAGKNTYGSGDLWHRHPRTDSWTTAARAKASRKGRRRPWPAPATSFSRPAASLTRRELIRMSPTLPVVTLVCPHFSSDPRPAGRPRSLARIEMVVASGFSLTDMAWQQANSAASRPVALVRV